MPYDSGQDKVLKEYDPIDIGNDNTIAVKIMKYGAGEPKVSIQKTFTTKAGEERATGKLGRIEYETLVALNEVLQQACEDLHDF